MYMQCIEYYDKQNDPIKFYFQQKLNKILDRKKAYYLIDL